MPTSSHWPTLAHSHIHTCTNIHSEPVKVNFKRVSTSQIPPVSQPAALFVDQRTDNKSFYRLALLHPSSSFNATFLRHSLFLPLSLTRQTLISSQLLHIILVFLPVSLAHSHLLSLVFPFSLSLFLSLSFYLPAITSVLTSLPPSPFPLPPLPLTVWRFLLLLFSLPQSSGAWEPAFLLQQCLRLSVRVCICERGYVLFTAEVTVYVCVWCKYTFVSYCGQYVWASRFG